ncbi:hypothetical protein EJ06DRAFT_278853 [Trichodelitschia bisporula]|uniref:Uncharacterized protein n=1 Tax=Trichodelitschia bisporula TaxID=703511 RepID=A0A6G1I5Y1_9PEZI|nr:hypothetical protein EJ06DRAFT_278853 [Trichodelitschia bisporula]
MNQQRLNHKCPSAIDHEGKHIHPCINQARTSPRGPDQRQPTLAILLHPHNIPLPAAAAAAAPDLAPLDDIVIGFPARDCHFAVVAVGVVVADMAVIVIVLVVLIVRTLRALEDSNGAVDVV